MNDYFLIACTIERGGFSSERTFEIDLSEGGKLAGIANVGHVLDQNKSSLDEDTPAYGETIDGFVKCRKFRPNGPGEALIEVPSADVIHVSDRELTAID